MIIPINDITAVVMSDERSTPLVVSEGEIKANSREIAIIIEMTVIIMVARAEDVEEGVVGWVDGTVKTS